VSEVDGRLFGTSVSPSRDRVLSQVKQQMSNVEEIKCVPNRSLVFVISLMHEKTELICRRI
jgi:hypothetical protein